MSTEAATLRPESFDAPVGDSGESASAKNNWKASGAHALQAAEELKAAAEAKAREWGHAVDEKTHELREKAGEAYEDAKVRIRSLQQEAEGYVRDNPLKAVLAAAGAGFILGMLARKS
jgi:ElaB/YqjD/DUF883 family membrane-anchored ribosome-binding protein